MSGRAVVSYGEGRHVVVVAAREELATPARVSLPEPEPAPGLILPSGEINWGCPCLGGMATGPCGSQFRDAFSCFHYSEAEPKGGDCYEKFSVMQQCMSQYPELYGKDDGDDELAAALEDSAAAPASTGAASVGAASTGAASAGAASTGAASTGAASAGAAYTASSAATDNTQN